jgi:hypothetical protein
MNEPDRNLRSSGAIDLVTARILAPEPDGLITNYDRLVRAVGDVGLATVTPRG